ncbi:hypothetical protein CB0940_04898 [Cercospora beticola]|uniref:Uncharacterized protein n=1 Tax=Cercospora beticola TaxID=122368 RepID=A0A2G5HJ48_CERBT|nr:hypothetical protein CB0940_04898 [Cercospora beticola]PIA92559.1 hypothetical protein CB0940_04898 [Cercospora beticola]WPB02181.1 hypothetical protein RHO25_006815 [Cercospora beticola]CAK1362960.1 unnamed protein product [Cercospora beticola]
MSAKIISASILSLLAAGAAAQSASASFAATNCQVQDGSLVCTAAGDQYRVTDDVDLSNPPTSYSVCEALSETTIECVGVDQNGTPTSNVQLEAVGASGSGGSNSESAMPTMTESASESMTTGGGGSAETTAIESGASTTGTSPSETMSGGASQSSAPAADGNSGVALSADSAWALLAMLGAAVMI